MFLFIVLEVKDNPEILKDKPEHGHFALILKVFLLKEVISNLRKAKARVLKTETRVSKRAF